MKTKSQVAVAVAAGYFLGRTRRMKLALMLAAAGATGRFPAGPRDLVERGTKMLASSPEVAKLGESVKGELVEAARAALVTAAGNRIDNLNNRLQSTGKDTLRTGSDLVEDVTGGVAEDLLGESGTEESGEEEESAPKRKGRTSKSAGDNKSAAEDHDDAEDEEKEDTTEQAERKRTPPRRRRTTRTAEKVDAAPVRRTNR